MGGEFAERAMREAVRTTDMAGLAALLRQLQGFVNAHAGQDGLLVLTAVWTRTQTTRPEQTQEQSIDAWAQAAIQETVRQAVAARAQVATAGPVGVDFPQPQPGPVLPNGAGYYVPPGVRHDPPLGG